MRDQADPTTIVERVPLLSVIIPAHNEARVIERCLRSVLQDDASDQIEILVVCNGCTDDTAGVSASVSPQVRVFEAEHASKHAALNLGDRQARSGLRAYLDADTVLSAGAISALLDIAATPGVEALALEMAFDVTRCSRPARMFHRVWAQSPYFARPVLGTGFYALTATGRSRFDHFPPLVGDDFFVASLIPEERRAVASGHTFTPLLPRTLRTMIKVHVRHYGAHTELRDYFDMAGRSSELAETPQSYRWLLPLAARPANWPALGIFCSVKVAAIVLGRRKARSAGMSAWNRDESSRA